MLPIVYLKKDCLPRLWEDSICVLHDVGFDVPTAYDKPGDCPSIDAMAILRCETPFQEPRIHKCFPGGIEDLVVYEQEVVDGIHDHWMLEGGNRWIYTYHERLTNYTTSKGKINQLDYVVKELTKTPYSRRAIAITWKPEIDENANDCPCLQNLWFRLIDEKLHMVAQMRSNDAFKAAFMNMWAFTALQKEVTNRLSESLGYEIAVGSYTHVANSYHIYGSYIDEVEAFIGDVDSRPFEKRVWHTEDVYDIIEEAKQRIITSLEQEKLTGRKGL